MKAIRPITLSIRQPALAHTHCSSTPVLARQVVLVKRSWVGRGIAQGLISHEWRQHVLFAKRDSTGEKMMALKLHSADYRHEDGVTYCIKRESLDQNFTIYEKQNDAWIDSGLDQAVQDLNFAEFKRLGLLIKTIMDNDQWIA